MRNRLTYLIVLSLAACGGGSGDGDDDDGIDAAVPIDAPVVPCTGTTPFVLQPSPPELANINTAAAAEQSARLSSDGLTMYLVIDGGLHVSTRTTTSGVFSAPVPVVIPGAGSDSIGSPSLNAAGDTLYFTRQLPSKMLTPPFSVWRAPRSPDGTIGTPVQLTELEDPAFPDESLIGAYVLPDESAIYFGSHNDLFRAARLPSGSFDTPVWLEEIEPWPMQAQTALVTADELLMVVGARTSSETPLINIYTRTATTQPWGTAVEQPGFTNHTPSWLSPDGCRLYTFTHFMAPDRDVNLATRAP